MNLRGFFCFLKKPEIHVLEHHVELHLPEEGIQKAGGLDQDRTGQWVMAAEVRPWLAVSRLSPISARLATKGRGQKGVAWGGTKHMILGVGYYMHQILSPPVELLKGTMSPTG